MDNIIQLQSTLVMIFQTDEIPIPSLRRIEALNHLNRTYKLQLTQQVDPFMMNQNQLILRNGEFFHDDVLYLIDEIQIDSRRLIIKMNATSEIIDIFFNIFREELINLDVRKRKCKLIPLITTYDTSCVCCLNFNLIEYIGGKNINSLTEKIEEKIPKYDSKISLIPASIKFKIDYFDIPAKIRKNKITLSEKNLIIEYREKTNPEDRIYFTSSPTKSDTHLEILKAFEDYITV
ncbi:MAG: hypothetical protein PF693_01165 [Spirochaetia bacterium]|jgi:hypothetical protein|nr:hypothetical protein [Spirochaetia bacterium]